MSIPPGTPCIFTIDHRRDTVKLRDLQSIYFKWRKSTIEIDHARRSMFNWFFSLRLYLTENSLSQLWRLIAARKHKRTYVRLHVKRPLFLSCFNHNHKCREVLFKIPNMKFRVKSISQGRKEYPAHNKKKANCTGHILRSSCLRQHVVEGKTEGMTEVTERRGRRRKQLLHDLEETTGYCKLKEEALDRTVWRTGFGRDCGPVVRLTTNE